MNKSSKKEKGKKKDKGKKGQEKPRVTANRPTRRPKEKGSTTKKVNARKESGSGNLGSTLTPREMRAEYIKLGVIVPSSTRPKVWSLPNSSY